MYASVVYTMRSDGIAKRASYCRIFGDGKNFVTSTRGQRLYGGKGVAATGCR